MNLLPTKNFNKVPFLSSLSGTQFPKLVSWMIGPSVKTLKAKRVWAFF